MIRFYADFASFLDRIVDWHHDEGRKASPDEHAFDERIQRDKSRKVPGCHAKGSFDPVGVGWRGDFRNTLYLIPI